MVAGAATEIKSSAPCGCEVPGGDHRTETRRGRQRAIGKERCCPANRPLPERLPFRPGVQKTKTGRRERNWLGKESTFPVLLVRLTTTELPDWKHHTHLRSRFNPQATARRRLDPPKIPASSASTAIPLSPAIPCHPWAAC